MSTARDRADRKGSTPIQIGSTKLTTDGSDNLSVTNASGTPKKLIASEIEIGDSSNKVIIKKGSDNKVAFQTQASGGSATDSNAGGGVTVVANPTALQALTNNAVGDLAFVSSNNKLYLRQTNGWYTVASVTNATPVISSAGNAEYTLAKDGTPTVVTISATDAEGETITYAHTVSSGSLTNGGGATATVTQGTGGNVNQFTITPSTNSAYAGTFSLTFTAQDPNGNTATSSASAFTLAFSVTNGSYYFDATTARLSTPSNSEFDIAQDEPFTLEFWYKYPSAWQSTGGRLASYQGNKFSISAKASSGGYTNFILLYKEVGAVVYGNSNTGTSLNTWYHLAVCRDTSNVWKLYIDGTAATSTATNNNAITGGTMLRLNGYALSDTSYLTTGNICYMADVRFVIGTCVYTGNFTRPTGALTTTGGTYSNTTNVNTSITASHTKLLTAQNSTGGYVDNSSNNWTLTKSGTGNITPSAGVPSS